uniref:Uncharacterized protein n=1 Tax=Myotis myotis TaxID=51298 RepID=A0A7J7WVY9_MYOMY|nr:hypothetical protein mMyoMyo1_011970 [Myotis myotis]
MAGDSPGSRPEWWESVLGHGQHGDDRELWAPGLKAGHAPNRWRPRVPLHSGQGPELPSASVPWQEGALSPSWGAVATGSSGPRVTGAMLQLDWLLGTSPPLPQALGYQSHAAIWESWSLPQARRLQGTRAML